MTPHEHHLSAVAGCAMLLAKEPKCKTAARKILAILRKELMKLELKDLGEGAAVLVALVPLGFLAWVG